MTPAQKDALGRAILREIRGVERYLYRLRAPENEVPDIALDAALLTWRKVATGDLVLPESTARWGAILAAYMRRVAFYKLRERKRSGDIYVRALRADDDAARHLGSYTIATRVEAWSELRAQPVSLHRFLLTYFAIGEIRATARALRMSDAAAYDALRRAQEHAQGKRRPPRGKRRAPKK